MTLFGFFLLERSRLGVAFRMIGQDGLLAAAQGVPVFRVQLMAACLAGAIAGLGGGLYAHLTTYVEPAIFDVMLGVHSLAYGLIGGLGTAFGPLLGVVIDIGLLESTRWFAGYRMIVFGGLVAVLLIVRPRGLLDERAGASDPASSRHAGHRRRPQTPLFSERNRHDRRTSLAAVAVCRDGFVSQADGRPASKPKRR